MGVNKHAAVTAPLLAVARPAIARVMVQPLDPSLDTNPLAIATRPWLSPHTLQTNIYIYIKLKSSLSVATLGRSSSTTNGRHLKWASSTKCFFRLVVHELWPKVTIRDAQERCAMQVGPVDPFGVTWSRPQTCNFAPRLFGPKPLLLKFTKPPWFSWQRKR